MRTPEPAHAPAVKDPQVAPEKSCGLGLVKVPPEIVMVGFVVFAWNLYHTSSLIVPQEPGMPE